MLGDGDGARDARKVKNYGSRGKCGSRGYLDGGLHHLVTFFFFRGPLSVLQRFLKETAETCRSLHCYEYMHRFPSKCCPGRHMRRAYVYDAPILRPCRVASTSEQLSSKDHLLVSGPGDSNLQRQLRRLDSRTFSPRRPRRMIYGRNRQVMKPRIRSPAPPPLLRRSHRRVGLPSKLRTGSHGPLKTSPVPPQGWVLGGTGA
jgi:hypothetical protein